MINEDFDVQLGLQVAEGAARAAGALMRRAYRLPRRVIDKGINDLVTETDHASEVLITNVLSAAFPACNIAGEESAHVDRGAPLTWWIDPLDGTYNFVHGVPRFSVSIGLIDQAGMVLVGVVYDPMFDECYTACRGKGAFCNGERIYVSKASALRHALAASGFPADLRPAHNNTAEWSAFVPRCQGMARMGSAALDLCYVATGRFDLYWEYGLAPWDMSAGVLMVQEAGGRISDYSGKPFNVHARSELLSSNDLLHDEAVSVFHAVRQVQD